MNTMTDLTVAHTILTQLGGNRFIAMTGARNFVGGNDALTFSVPRAAHSIRKVRVTYVLASDTYSIDFFAGRDFRRLDVYSRDHVYFHQLQSLFTAATGLDTKL